VVLREFFFKITIKKLQIKWHDCYSNPGSPGTMAGTLTIEPLGHLVTAADLAYLIVTDVLIIHVHVPDETIHTAGRVYRHFVPHFTHCSCSATKVVLCYLLNKCTASFTIVPYCRTFRTCNSAKYTWSNSSEGHVSSRYDKKELSKNNCTRDYIVAKNPYRLS